MARVQLDFYDLDDDALPDVCMKCGAPATTRKYKTFSWHPPWVLVLILLGIWPYLIVAMILTKRRRVSMPFCDAHKNHYAWRWLATFGGLAVPLLLLVAAAVFGGENDNVAVPFILGAVLGLLVWLIAVAVIFSTAIKPSEITDRTITLKNVSVDFAQAYDDMVRQDEYPPVKAARIDRARPSRRREDDYPPDDKVYRG